MKQLIYLSSFCILLAFFIGCKKDNDYSKSIVGTWELRQRSGSIGTTIFTKGNGNILKFTNSNYEIYVNGALSKSGVYTLIPDNTVQESTCLVLPSSEYKSRIVLDGNDDSRKTFIKISTIELNLVSGCFAVDAGTSSVYQRQ